jgi:hypothetical protein
MGLPIVPCSGGAKSNAASTRKGQVERYSPTYRPTRLPFFPTPQPLLEISPWHKANEKNAQLCQHLLDMLRDVA